MVWCSPEWKTRKIYPGTIKEVFNTELYAIVEALDIALKKERVGLGASRRQIELAWTKVHIWADPQAAIKRL